MAPTIESSTLAAKIVSLVTADPGPPRANPTPSFWQQPPHPSVSTHQSPTLRAETDVVVIGSGATGCSVTKALLEESSFGPIHVTVLEARTLVSGATGRNGGHLVSPVGHTFGDIAAEHGVANAREISRFSLRNVQRVQEVVATLPEHIRRRSELRTIEKICAVGDEKTWEHHKASLAMFEREVPEHSGHHWLVNNTQLQEDWAMVNVLGGIAQNSGALWPYRLFTEIFHYLLKKYPNNLSIETNTPVLSVAEQQGPEYPYIVMTPRGAIRAKKIVYCTNAHTSHILPLLRGKIYPLRGHVSVQDGGPNFPNMGAKRSWSLMIQPRLDPVTQVLHEGLYYLQQNARTKDVFIGVDCLPVDELLSSDDTFVSAICHKDLRELMPRLFAASSQDKVNRERVKSIWSGIMGMTADGFPLVGKLPYNATGRHSGQEWIAAGYNGYGMDKTWMTGEAVVAMMADKDVSEWFPSAYIITEERVTGNLGLDKIVNGYVKTLEETVKDLHSAKL